MFHVKVKGLEQLRQQLDGFSDRRFAAGIATGLSRTAVALKGEFQGRLPEVFDRPTPYTLNSLFVKPARADDLVAAVWFKDDRAASQGGIPATKYLLPQVRGGERSLKRMERLLAMAGHLPDGYVTVPGQGARLDGYGNMERGQLIQILSQLRITAVSGFTRNMAFDAGKQIAAQRRAGGRFFVVPVGGRTAPGVYQREFNGRNITPVLMFVKRAAYQRRFDFDGIARQFVAQRLPAELQRAFGEQMQRLAAKGRA